MNSPKSEHIGVDNRIQGLEGQVAVVRSAIVNLRAYMDAIAKYLSKNFGAELSMKEEKKMPEQYEINRALEERVGRIEYAVQHLMIYARQSCAIVATEIDRILIEQGMEGKEDG